MWAIAHRAETPSWDLARRCFCACAIRPDGESECYLEVYGLEYLSERAEGYYMSVLDPDGKMLGDVAAPTIQSHMYGGKTDWCINLGIIPADVHEIALAFDQSGEYVLQSARVVSESIKLIEEDRRRLALGHDKVGYEFHHDAMECEVPDGEDGRYLVITTSWSSGWTATIDGVSAEVLKADTAFMAVRVPSGKHAVRLAYRTPLLLEGLVVSLASIFATAWLARKHRIEKRA